MGVHLYEGIEGGVIQNGGGRGFQEGVWWEVLARKGRAAGVSTVTFSLFFLRVGLGSEAGLRIGNAAVDGIDALEG